MSGKTKEAKENVRSQPAATLEPTVDELAERLGLKPWQKAGLFRAQGWAPGKRVSEQEFKAKLAAWMKGPMSR
ncbi:MAG: hypothetical protein BAA04_01635 [Firmicutes bacterium ZCTH02-B6]|nr:MAG: hypothetical protein BAA04_01635 [Firmicutes bacterium ZCTH02-B6]